jgi:hypothetical protein
MSGRALQSHRKKKASTKKASTKKSCKPPSIWKKGHGKVRGKCLVYKPIFRKVVDTAAIEAAAKVEWDEREAAREERKAAAMKKEKREELLHKKHIDELEESGYSGGDPLAGLRVFAFLAEYSERPRLTEPPFWAADINQRYYAGEGYILDGLAAAPNDQIIEAWLRSLGPLKAGPPADDKYYKAELGWRHDVWIRVEDLETNPESGTNPRAAMIMFIFGDDYKEKIAPLLPPNLL